MAAMSTALTHFSTNGDSRSWTTSGHSVSKPKLVIQKRRVPLNQNQAATTEIRVVHAAIDAESAVMEQKVDIGVMVKIPMGIKAGETTVTDVLTILKDIVNGDEFAATLNSQNFLKP